MESKAKAQFLRGSARKMRIVADLVRKKSVTHAISMLHEALSQKASYEIEKVIRAAVANIQSREEGSNIDIDDLYVKSIAIDIGPQLKRIKPRAQGRAYLRLHRMNHVTVVVSD